MAYILPPRRCLSVGPGVFRSGPSWTQSPESNDPSRALSSRLGVLRLDPAAPLPTPVVAHGRFHGAPRVRSLPLRHMRMSEALLPLSSRRAPGEKPLPPGDPVCRVWLPSARSLASRHPRRPLSTSNALGVRPSELFSRTAIPIPHGTGSPRALAVQTLRPGRGASGASSPRPEPYSCDPEGLVPGGALALVGLPASQALSRGNPGRGFDSHAHPLTPFRAVSFPSRLRGPQGLANSRRRRFSPKRAPACLAFPAD